MKGLLLKDCFTLVKQMKIFLLIIIVFSLVPGYSMSAFAIVYSALLPMSALAYDERSKWDSLAAMMPYRPRDMVLSKYLLGVGAVLAAVVLSFIAQKQIRGDGNRTSNIVMNLSMVNAMIMFIGLFGTANNFARLANYFLIFQTLSLPWVMKYYTMGSRRFLTVGAVAGYLGYYYYGAAIANGAFDDIYSFITFFDFLKQLS